MCHWLGMLRPALVAHTDALGAGKHFEQNSQRYQIPSQSAWPCDTMRLLLSHKSQIIVEAQIRKAVHAGRKFAFNSSVLDQAYPKEGTTAGALYSTRTVLWTLRVNTRTSQQGCGVRGSVGCVYVVWETRKFRPQRGINGVQ